MKYFAVALAAACAAALVVSCASAPRATPLTIELFDSRAPNAPSARTVDAGERLSLPDPPPIQSLVPTTSGPVATAKAATAPAVAATGAVDASLVSPIRPPNRPQKRPGFALAAPAIPAAATRATANPAAAGAGASASSSQKQAPSQKPAPSRSGTAAASSSIPALPAAPSSGSQPAAASSSGPTASPYGRLREIYARQGDVVQVGLNGVGFLFLGLPDAQSDGMAFKSKENRENKTLFTFQAQKIGTYDLDFLQQDNMAGKTSRETVRVHVVSEQDFNAAVASTPAPEANAASAPEGDALFAQKLATLGSYEAAVAELLKGYREGNPGLNDQIAVLYMKMGSYDAAEKYYDRNLIPRTDYTPRAVVGLMRVAVLQNDQQALLSHLKDFLALNDPSLEEPMIQAVRMEKARGEIGFALDLAGEYVTRFPDGKWRDEADFLTAQLLEADSQFRDIPRARQLYDAIVTGRPESTYAEAARLREQYIDRHFYQVR